VAKKASTPRQKVQPEQEKPKGLEGFYRLQIEAFSKSGLTKGVGYAINFHADENEVIGMFDSAVLKKWRGLVTGIVLRHRDDVFDPRACYALLNATRPSSSRIEATQCQPASVSLNRS